MGLTAEAIRRFLEARYGLAVRLTGVRSLSGAAGADTVLKGFGYGEPLQVNFEVGGGPHSLVLTTLRPGPFGHEHLADRAQALLWSYDAYERLPRHVRAVDVGFVDAGGKLTSAAGAVECFLLMERADGEPYARDLERIRRQGRLGRGDLQRAVTLAEYLAGIHAVPGPDPALYDRRLRDTLGMGEGIMGVLDSYPPDFPLLPRKRQRDVEQGCVALRYRLKEMAGRLRQVHGDFHPWNILFGAGTDFHLLDRSRGEWGEPADDVAALSINYVLFALLRQGRFAGPFAELFEAFYETYLLRAQDMGVTQALPFFYVFRGLVIASPVWYPTLREDVRSKLLRFVETMLVVEDFEHQELNAYLGVEQRSPASFLSAEADGLDDGG
jgi:hypothetical protein